MFCRKNVFFLLWPLWSLSFAFWEFPVWCGSDPTLEMAEKLRTEILVHGQAYANLRELTAIGSRLSGSDAAARAVTWGQDKLASYGFDQVSRQPVQVPRWERGKIERASIISTGAKAIPLRVAALGNSVGTPAGGVEASVVEVQSLKEVAELGEKLKGKIVFYNHPMDATLEDTFKAYGEAGDQRFAGPRQAAKFGAVAVLVRSLTLLTDDHPHTGATHYDPQGLQIPAAALSTVAADRLSARLKAQPITRVRLELSAHPMGMVESFNVVGELTGSEKPAEIVLVGGHLDSWDLGPGAHDDGAGVVQSIEVLRALKALGVHPRRTLRVVLFMSEEFGGYGGREYAKQAMAKKEKHLAAIESDRGGFTPRGFSVVPGGAALDRLRQWAPYLSVVHADQAVAEREGETDIDPLRESGTTLFGLLPDSQRYFDYHHAETDTIDAVNARELHLSAMAMAILSYLLTDRGL